MQVFGRREVLPKLRRVQVEMIHVLEVMLEQQVDLLKAMCRDVAWPCDVVWRGEVEARLGVVVVQEVGEGVTEMTEVETERRPFSLHT